TLGFNIEGVRGYAPVLKIFIDSTGSFIEGQIFSAIQRPQIGLEVDSLNGAGQLIQKLSTEDFPATAPFITEEGKILPRAISDL
ncbi:MAG: hypothetical protein ACPL28_07760, partial [bacterium]